MEDFLASNIFRYGIFPIGGAILGILLKCVTRNDRYTFFKKEDMAVGMDLMLTGLLLFIVVTTDWARDLSNSNKLLAEATKATSIDMQQINSLRSKVHNGSSRLFSAAWIILAMFFGLWAVSTIVRKWGWKDDSDLNKLIGIAFPLFFGIISLVVVMAAATR